MRFLVLASGSPRRSEFLLRAGIVFDVVPADIDETQGPGEPPATYAARLADEKAAVVRARRPEAWVLAADTIVVEGGEVLGKPDDGADAARMLARLAGRRHTVMTATCLAGPAGERVRRLVVTEVAFRALPADEIASYVESGEWQGKAGGYGIQGRAAAFVEAVVGSYTSVTGLPLSETLEDLAALGLARPRYR